MRLLTGGKPHKLVIVAIAQEQPARNPTDNPLRLAFSPASTARNASRVSAANDIDAAITITVASTYSALYP